MPSYKDPEYWYLRGVFERLGLIFSPDISQQRSGQPTSLPESVETTSQTDVYSRKLGDYEIQVGISLFPMTGRATLWLNKDPFDEKYHRDTTLKPFNHRTVRQHVTAWLNELEIPLTINQNDLARVLKPYLDKKPTFATYEVVRADVMRALHDVYQGEFGVFIFVTFFPLAFK